MNNITEKVGFKLIKKLNMKGSNVGITKHRTVDEKIYIFSKGQHDKKLLNKHIKSFKCIKTKKTLKK